VQSGWFPRSNWRDLRGIKPKIRSASSCVGEMTHGGIVARPTQTARLVLLGVSHADSA